VLVMLALFAVGAVAGLVDAIAGGGGLLTLPALWLLAPGLDPRQLLGTNKGQGVFGTATSLQRFASSPLLDRRRAWASFPPALAGAALGALLVSFIRPEVLTPVVMIMLGMAAVLVIIQRPPHLHLETRPRPWWMAAVVGFILAGYDGFFGPGTGTFLILAYTWLWHDPLDAASANAKVVNFASNLASMAMFAWLGLIVWSYALPMAAGQVVGGYLGAHLTIRVGRKLVRYVVVGVSLALMLRLAWQMFGG
jgi:uncharacterized protein